MKKDSILAVILSAGMILVGLLLFLYILPFLYIMAAYGSDDVENMMKLEKTAVKISVFKSQKIYTINSVLGSLVLTKDYSTAIAYFKILEKLGATDKSNTKLVTYAYMKTGDYNTALNYAIKNKDKNNQAKIYIYLKDYKKANEIIDNLLESGKENVNSLAYKAELLLLDGKYNEANEYIDKALQKSPKFVDALYLKGRILNKLGKPSEAKKYINHAKLQEIKRTNLYK